MRKQKKFFSVICEIIELKYAVYYIVMALWLSKLSLEI